MAKVTKIEADCNIGFRNIVGLLRLGDTFGCIESIVMSFGCIGKWGNTQYIIVHAPWCHR